MCIRDSYYTPVAADDQESWACHLTPALLWKYKKQILDPNMNDDEMDARIDSIMDQT